jgi:HlyD family secretion protein
MTDASRRRLLIWGGIALVALVALFFALRPPAVSVEVAAAARGPMRVTLDHEGRTRVRDRYAVSAPVAGTVRRIELEPGDPVVGGETVVATFAPSEPIPLDARSRAEAEAAAAAAKTELDRAEASAAAAEAEAKRAGNELDRRKGLAAQGVVSASELEAAETAAKSAEEASAAARAAVGSARHQLAAARARLLEPADSVGGRTVVSLKAPIDGVVLQRLHESQAPVAAGTPLLELANLDDLETASDYLSADAVEIRAGMPVEIDQWGGSDPLKGVVRKVEPYGFTKISALGVEEQRVWVITSFTDPRTAWQHLGDGYRVETKVETWHGDDVLQVPEGALFRRGDGWALFTDDDGRARLKDVKVGHRDGLKAEILSGLDEGAPVIVNPSDDVADGTRVAKSGS